MARPPACRPPAGQRSSRSPTPSAPLSSQPPATPWTRWCTGTAGSATERDTGWVGASSWDLIVAGAGPAGAAAALEARRLAPDARVLLLDRERFPRDKACGDG